MQFYPGTQNPQQAVLVTVKTGAISAGIDFSVVSSGAPQLYGVTTYAFPSSLAVHPAFENFGIPKRWLVASGTGLLADGAATPGLSISVLGNAAWVVPGGIYPYYLDPTDYLQVNLQFTPFSGEGPRHLVFTAGEEVYVLPSSVILVSQPPPSIANVAPGVDASGNPSVTISGSTLQANTRILFDGLLATVTSFDAGTGSLTVAPPAGASNYQANVVALNSDGQTSLFTQVPPTYTYGSSPQPSISLSVSSLAAGAEAMIEVQGVNTSFTDGQTSLGFGSSDVWVKRLAVISPTLLRAEVVVAAAAPAGRTLVTATTGFQAISQPAAFQVLPANAQAMVASSSLVNAVTQQAWVYPGAEATLAISNLPSGVTPVVTLDGIPATVIALGPNQVTFQVPAGASLGMDVLRIQVGSAVLNPIAVWIDPPPPTVVSVTDYGTLLDANHPAYPGDVLTIQVSGLGDGDATVDASRLEVNVGGVNQQIGGPAVPAPGAPGQYQILIVLSNQVPAGPQPLTVSIDYRTSAPFTITVL
jgi:uncharacterized protein (TIGR03437 family)